MDDILAEAKSSGTRAFMTIGLVYATKQVLDAENETHVQVVRLAYVAAFLFQIAVTLYIRTKVAKLEGNEAMVTVVKKENPFDTEEMKIKQSIHDYDSEQVTTIVCSLSLLKRLTLSTSVNDRSTKSCSSLSRARLLLGSFTTE